MSASRPSRASRSIGNRLQDSMFRIISRAHVGLYQLSGGTIGGRMYGAPVLVLTTTGRKTGKQRRTPLMYLRDGNELVIVASKGGAPQDPMWWRNLTQTPEAGVQIGPTTHARPRGASIA